MNRLVASGVATAAALAVACLALPGATAAEEHRPHSAVPTYYTTKTPYVPQESLRDYQRAPKGFSPVFTENVARHGDRAMTRGDDMNAVLALLADAQSKNALTPLGAQLAPQIQQVMAGAESIGYSTLSASGAAEHHGTGERMVQRLPSLFAKITADNEPIEVYTSGVDRAIASSKAFTSGLTEADPALAADIQAPVTNKDLLYFHKQPQNAAYQDYVNNDPDLAAVLARINGQPKTAKVAEHILSRLFTADFVASVSSDDRIAFAQSLYETYASAPDLSVEAPDVNLVPFLTPSDAKWFAYLDDSEEFYESGPGFSDRTITYAMANVLLDDLFAQAKAKADGTSDAGAVLRFTHAEDFEPLAVVLGLPGSTKGADAGTPYTYENNPWRGEKVAPMATNVQWDLFAGTPKSGHGHGQQADGQTQYLVRMLYNEKETAFKAGCKPIAKGSYFYDLNELERCYNRS